MIEIVTALIAFAAAVIFTAMVFALHEADPFDDQDNWGV
jgi:hypothetical protein